MIAGVLGVEDVLIDDERGAPGLRGVTHSDLADGAVLAEYIVHLFCSDLVGQVPDVEDPVNLRGKPHVGTSSVHRHPEY